MGKTISEKILGAHAGGDVSAGDIVIAELDYMMAQDGTAPLAVRSFDGFKEGKVANPGRVAFCIDHSAPSPLKSVSDLHAIMRTFTGRYGLELNDIGSGVCHQVMLDRAHALPGSLVIGADSHTCTYGAVNAFATGVGSTDFAVGMLTGNLWFRVPETIKITIGGKLGAGVFSKDIALMLVGDITADGATYQALELSGSAISDLDLDGRLTISNLAVEMGAKAGLMEADEKTLEFFRGRTDRPIVPVTADGDAEYAKELQYDISDLAPQVAKPHTVDNVVPVEEVEGTPIAQGLVGTCTNGRLADLRAAAEVVKGAKVDTSVRMIVAPASREIMIKAVREGLIETFLEAGATVVPPGCACCVGTHQGVPSDGENVISTANRNFKGRMGNGEAFIYLASPATVAASCLEGRIADPRKHFES
ncbi:MAG: 3-isopropylmalate dehydratase large subunit [Actinobacteria bacterium]|nr:3-isopropylmalate dehydratase large subunit [Actinomycetota bacterium]